MNDMTAQKNSMHGVHRRVLSIQHVRLFIIPLIFLCLGLPSARADNLTVTVGVYENAPKVFTSEDGHPSGIFIDIIEFIAKSEGWKLHYVSGTWAEGLDRLAKGEIDLMPDVAYTAERGKKFSFHKVQALSAWIQAYARKGSGIQSLLDLNGKRIAVLEGSVQQEAFIRFSQGFGLNINIIPVPDYGTAFEIVANGKADAAITNQFYGAMNARKFGLEDTAIVFEPSALFFATTKGTHEQLLNTIDNYLRDMKKDPQSMYYRSLKRWTSEEVRFKFPVWLQILGLAAGVALLVSFGASVVLKRQVNARTHELHTALQRFVDIVEFLPDATFVVDQNKKIIAWNQACENITGVKKESLLGQSNYAYAEPFFGEQRPILIDLLDVPMPEMEASYKYVQRIGNKLYAESFIQRLRGGLGAYLWGVASPLYDKDGQRCGAIESIRDVTEQKRIEEALRTSERKYRELVMLANTIILHWSHDGKIIFMNEFGLQFFGYTEAELLGRHVVGTIVPENESTGRDLRPLMEDIGADTKNFERHINENMRSNGERVWIDWANKVVLDERGQIKEILSIGSDITERKKAEEQIHRLNDELQRHAEVLEQRVAERTSELAKAMEKAQAADKIKSAFLATMSHELRTPLNSIIGFSGILLQEMAGPLNEEQKKQLGMVCSSAEHLLSLINDVLDISKIEASQLTLASEPFDLRAAFTKVIATATPMAEKKGLVLESEIAPKVRTITSDQRRVEQILLNLVSNAIKFTEHGRVRVVCSLQAGHVLIRVIDTGIGIKQEDMDKLFRPFQQVDSGIERQREGTGLGLSISKKLVEMLGGTIQVESEWGRGSTFSFTLPVGRKSK
jgi:PAS domain S-box-containing protein